MSERRQSVAFTPGRRDDLPVTRWKRARPDLATHRRTILTAVGGGCLIVALLTQIPAGRWSALWNVVATRWWLVLLLAAGTAGLIAGGKPGCRALKMASRQPEPKHEPSAAPQPPDRRIRPIASWTIPAGALAVVAVTWWAVTWLQGNVPGDGTALEREKLRVESIRTGLSVGAGAAGALALLLAFRRQQIAERTQQADEYDASEKRVTELYVKAADQLGSDKAPVRLAGLYALERLAQDNPEHRQSIVEVICAYLRMPYTPPDEPLAASSDAAVMASTSHADDEPAPSNVNPATAADGAHRPAIDPREERQVRLAAQHILARHLRSTAENGEPNPAYWGPRTLDLTGAALTDLDFSDCTLHRATFPTATFHGVANFFNATFHGDAIFDDATFLGELRLTHGKFKHNAWFLRVTFHDVALFSGATFSYHAAFNRARFRNSAGFGSARFGDSVTFDDTTFDKDAGFDMAVFSHVKFRMVKVNGVAWFNEATFDGVVRFDKATFGNGIRFHGLIIGPRWGNMWLEDDVWPEGWRFDEATRTLVEVTEPGEDAPPDDATTGELGQPCH